MKLIIRKIKKEDNDRIAEIIRTVMPEYDCVGEDYSINDPELDDMHGNYQAANSIFFVVENEVNHVVYGGGGFSQLKGENISVCELQKMYFLKDIRGYGMGRKILQLCIDQAKEFGFQKMYLETVYRMKGAEALYRKMGFEDIDGPMGNTGHSACDHFMIREL